MQLEMEYHQYSVNNSLNKFCLPLFWDRNSTWNLLDSEVINCFEKTILIWLPSVFLWLFSPLEIYFLFHARKRKIPFNRYNTLKLAIITILGTSSLVDITYCYFFSGQMHVLVNNIHLTVMKILTFGLLFGLTYANVKCGITSSGILFSFSLLLTLCGASQTFRELASLYNLSALKSDLNNGRNQVAESFHSYAYLGYYFFVLFLFLLSCFADTRPVSGSRSDEKNLCPEKDSSFLSKILFTWVDRFVWKGFKTALKYEDLWDLDNEMQTVEIVKAFESKWNLAVRRLQKEAKIMDVEFRQENQNLLDKETTMSGGEIQLGYKPSDNAKKASILRPLYEVFGWHFWIGVMLIKLLDSGLLFASPPVLNSILVFVGKQDVAPWHGCFYAILLLAISVLGVLSQDYYLHLMYRGGLQIRTALISAIYKKVFKISNGARKNFSLGKIINLIAVDAQIFTQVLPYFPYVWIAPVEICVAVYYLWSILGVCVLAGVAVMVCLTVANCMFLSRIQKLRIKQMKYKDKRLKLTNEVLSGIKILKLYACEPSFEELIVRIRQDEIKTLKDTAYLRAGSTFTWICSSFLLSYVTFGLYALWSEENGLDAQVVFVSLSLFNVIKKALELLPMILSRTIQANVAVKRIDEFLNLEELDPNAVSHEQRVEPIIVENGKFSWENNEKTPTLNSVNIKINPGNLVAIVGQVGSGKSSLLSAILGEMYKHSGYVNTTGKLAYVSQQAWIRNTTFQENITFGDEASEKAFYDVVLEACALTSDLEILPDGDRTEIGEKGVNLSGGQKQRVSLARAVYSKADTYLLDDPLSAVDVHVGKHIFEKVIGPNGLLKNTTRVLVTHNVTFLPQVDHIIVLQDGTISENGTYEGLLKKGGSFSSFLAHHLKENDKSHVDGKEKIYSREDGQEESLKTSTAEPKNSSKSGQKDDVRKVTEIEEVSTGNAKWKVHTYYLRAIRPILMGTTILANVLFQAFTIKSDYCLSEWASVAKSSKITNAYATTQYGYLGVYALYGTAQAISITAQTIVLFVGTLDAAKYFHNRLLNSVLHWPVVTFDHIPFGRILNRFGFDVDVLDSMPQDLLNLVTYVGVVTSSLIVISFNTPWFLSTLLPLGGTYYFTQKVYTTTSKQLKRLESASKSPIFSHFGDSVAGETEPQF